MQSNLLNSKLKESHGNMLATKATGKGVLVSTSLQTVSLYDCQQQLAYWLENTRFSLTTGCCLRTVDQPLDLCSFCLTDLNQELIKNTRCITPCGCCFRLFILIEVFTWTIFYSVSAFKSSIIKTSGSSVCNLHMYISTQECALLYAAIYDWGLVRGRVKDWQVCVNAAADHFYHIILWLWVWKRVTCLCFAGYAPFLAKRMMKWSQMGKEQNSFLRKKGKGVTWKKKLWMSAKVTGECTISYNSDLNPTKKRKSREKSYTPMAMKLLIS